MTKCSASMNNGLKNKRKSACGICFSKFYLGGPIFSLHLIMKALCGLSHPPSTLHGALSNCCVYCLSLSMHGSQISTHCSPLIDDQSPQIKPFKFWWTIPSVAVLSWNLDEDLNESSCIERDPSNYKQSHLMLTVLLWSASSLLPLS